MRVISVLCLLLLLCGFAAAQVTIIGGTASNWAPGYGVYAAPFVPLVTTPEVTLSTVSPTAVGARNATWGNVAGATNSTLSREFVAEPPVGVYTEPVWYGPSAAGEGRHGSMHARREAGEEQAFDFGETPRESRESVARLMTGSGPARKASRTYTNQDVDQVNQHNGTVKYNGKTEHI
ncbi:MAG: hypothetical protein WB952_19780 [Terriglobales bacterium]